MDSSARLNPRFPIAIVVAASALLALTAAPGIAQSAAAPTRAEYIAQADPICKQTFQKRLPKVHGKNDVKGYIRVFTVMGTEIDRMADRLDPLPKPTADVLGLTNWLKSLHSWSNGSLKAARALRHRNVHGFKASLRQMNKAQAIRKGAVKTFGFEICG